MSRDDDDDDDDEGTNLNFEMPSERVISTGKYHFLPLLGSSLHSKGGQSRGQPAEHQTAFLWSLFLTTTR